MGLSEVGESAAVVVALKAGEFAKSRLGSLPDPVRRRLAWTMAVDTLRALAAATEHVLVVSDQPALRSRLLRLGLDVEVVPEAGPGGMNAALSQGASALRAADYRTIVASVGDLPALQPDSVRRVLALSRSHPRSFLADASGVGTTMLITHTGDLDPHFQGRSAAAHHASGAVPLTEVPLTEGPLTEGPLTEVGPSLADARRDVDTEVDLYDAIRLGLGAATDALVDHTTLRFGTYRVVTATEWVGPDGTPLAVTSTGHRVALPPEALSDGIRHVRLGQRLHAVLTDDRVLSAWL
jgi:2-phospho-L-lactate guanylyltransferase